MSSSTQLLGPLISPIVGPLEYVLLALTCVALVWLLYREVYMNPDGFTAFSSWANASIKNPMAWRGR